MKGSMGNGISRGKKEGKKALIRPYWVNLLLGLSLEQQPARPAGSPPLQQDDQDVRNDGISPKGCTGICGDSSWPRSQLFTRCEECDRDTEKT